MAKLHIVIADLDGDYARGLSEYINSNHSSTFMVSCFTKPDSFAGYLEKKPPVDILVISPDFYDASGFLPKAGLRLILSSGILNREYVDFQVIDKYGTGEKILSEMIHLLSKSNPAEVQGPMGLHSSKLIAVYSPAGGTGKTTIAAALARQCAETGIRSFYLNLETIQSTGMLFGSGNKRNLSYVYYYIKEGSKNLSFRMDGIKDTADGVSYFSPPESPLEHEEIDPDELEQLLLGVKGMGCCDYVFIDMSNAFDSKNYRILSLCDHVVLVALQDAIVLYKSRAFIGEIDKYNDSGRGNISLKLITVINRYKGTGESMANLENSLPVPVYIPEYYKAYINEEGRFIADDDNFSRAVGQVIKKIKGS